MLVCVFVHTCGAKHQEIVVLVQMSQPGAELELFYYIKHTCNQHLLARLAQEDERKVTELQVSRVCGQRRLTSSEGGSS